MPAVELLSHPFRVTGAGRAATVSQESDEAAAEGLGRLILTRIGERPLVPGYGIPDPTFAGLNIAALSSALIRYGPPVRIAGVETARPDDATARHRLSFERIG
jgi:hypothetical protein